MNKNITHIALVDDHALLRNGSCFTWSNHLKDILFCLKQITEKNLFSN